MGIPLRPASLEVLLQRAGGEAKVEGAALSGQAAAEMLLTSL